MVGLTSHTVSVPRAHRPPALRVVAVTTLALALFLTVVAGAWATPPPNDDFESATPISQLPFTDAVDDADASIESFEPQWCAFAQRTVWYAITPSRDGTIAADTTGSTAFAQVTAYRADAAGLGGLTFLGCANFSSERAVFEVTAGDTYYLQAGAIFNSGGVVRLHVDEIAAPANDDFADATAIGSTPFSASVDLTAATVEASEPTDCQGSPVQSTAWYAFTATQSASYALQRSDSGPVAVYTGDSPGSLTRVTCAVSPTYFHADAGTTYHLQVARGWGLSGPLQLTLDVAPDAVASFFFNPSDPSIFDDVQFFDFSFDPAGIASRTWRLGDGFTATDCCPAHRYAADGDYAAELTVTTNDGRSASSSQVVRVRTHDVAIAKLTVPQSARVGQTRQLAVAIANTRFDETVRVDLLRSVAGGAFEQVGQVTQAVPARSGGRTTSFNISYTFSAADATFGKVSFQAVATTLTARDAVPADNTVTALPTKVAR